MPVGVSIVAEAAAAPAVEQPEGVITVAPGSSYQPPEELGEVTVTSVPYNAPQLPLTATMLAMERDAGAAAAFRRAYADQLDQQELQDRQDFRDRRQGQGALNAGRYYYR